MLCSPELDSARRHVLRACADCAIVSEGDVDAPVALQYLLERFLSNRPSRTLAAYEHDLDDFAAFCRCSRAAAVADLLARDGEMTRELIVAYAVDLRRRNRADATVDRHLATLRALARRAHAEGLTDRLLVLPSATDIAMAAGPQGHWDDAPYLFPRHVGEVNRLDVQHYATLEALGRHYRSPVVHPRHILDVGCGSGQWSYDVCTELPTASVVGLDLEPSKSDRPPNFAFVRGNLLRGLPFPDGAFDLVHQRFLASGVPLESWSAVVTDLARVTRSGGWLELVEGPPEIASAGPATEALLRLLRRLSRSAGLDAMGVVSRSIGGYLEKAGMVDVQRLTVELPIGGWGGRVGSLMASNMRSAMTSLSRSFQEALGVPASECRALIGAMQEEWDCHQSKTQLAIAFGRK